jgi:hypothetical protein
MKDNDTMLVKMNKCMIKWWWFWRVVVYENTTFVCIWMNDSMHWLWSWNDDDDEWGDNDWW